MKELELKYGCNPNQKPSRIYMEAAGNFPSRYYAEGRDILTSWTRLMGGSW